MMGNRQLPNCIALIPARAGSKRIAKKNIKEIGGHPALAYTIAAAVGSGVFEKVLVSTEDSEIAAIAEHYGAWVPFLRPDDFAQDLSPDFEWINYTMNRLKESEHIYDCFSILRPTSPFRLPVTIQNAWKAFSSTVGADSLRAVEKCKQHPYKMWKITGQFMEPLFEPEEDNIWYSMPYQALPEVYVQNASLEIAWTRVLSETCTIAGSKIIPFITSGFEGYDINEKSDWDYALRLVESREALLPQIDAKRWSEEHNYETDK